MALTEQVLMPGTDYQEIADQTRTLSGATGVLKSSEVGAKLQAANTTVTAQTAQINALIEQASNLPAAGSGGSGFPKFDLLYEHTVTAEEATTVTRFTVTTAEVPALNDYNVLVVQLEFADITPLTKWVAMYINNMQASTLCGSSTYKLSSYASSANRLFGYWVSGSTYDPTSWVMPALVVKTGAAKVLDDVVVTSVSLGSYAPDFGLVEGAKIRFYGAR